MKTIDLKGHVVLVTGGAGAIGEGIAREIARAGGAVIIADVADEQCERLARSIVGEGGRACGVFMDVTDAKSITSALEAGIASLGPLTGLVHVAGVLRAGLIEHMPLSEWRAIMEVNVDGLFLVTQASIPHLRLARDAAIVTISSVSASAATSGGVAYAASKGAVSSFTFALSGELAEAGVRVNAVCPGWVEGGFTDQMMAQAPDAEALHAQASSMHLLGRMAVPRDIGNAAAWLLSAEASFITGTALYVDGGFSVKH